MATVSKSGTGANLLGLLNAIMKNSRKTFNRDHAYKSWLLFRHLPVVYLHSRSSRGESVRTDEELEKRQRFRIQNKKAIKNSRTAIMIGRLWKRGVRRATNSKSTLRKECDRKGG